MRASHRSRAALTTLFGVSLVALVAVATTTAALGPAGAAVGAGVSDRGVVPVEYSDGTGGNVECREITQIATAADLESSGRIERQGNGFRGSFPAGLEVTLTSRTFVSWTSTFPIAAVIMKGSSSANVYVYGSPATSDAGLASPVGSSGSPAELSNITFCWFENGDGGNGNGGDPVDLQALCVDAATEAGVGDIVFFAGPVVIEDGVVLASTVPEGFTVLFDPMEAQVDFVAPFPVAAVVTEASDPVVYLVDPPGTMGSVPLTVNPGGGELVFCGIDTPIVVAPSCAEIGADAELGPIPIRRGTVDPAALPEGIVRLELAPSIRFEAAVPVVGAIVKASPEVLYVFPTPLTAGSIPVVVGEEDDLDLVLCALATSTGGLTSSGTDMAAPADAEVGALGDPTEIATGGGPSGRTLLTLISFLILAVTGSSTLLLASRGG